MDCDGSSLSTINSDIFNNRVEERDSDNDESESQEEESDGEGGDQEWNDIDEEEEKFGTVSVI